MIWCIIGIALIVAMFITAFSCRTRKENQEFIQSLTSDQLRDYENIKAERWNIFLNASIAGIVFGLGSVLIYNQSSKNSNALKSACIFTGVAFLVQYFWYILSPKDKWMIVALDTEKQRKEWRDTYIAYQKTYHTGIVLGIIGYFILGYNLENILKK